MYLPRHFAESRPDVLQALVRTEPLGTLVTEQQGGPVADELPFLLRPELGAHGTLQAHVARANPLWRDHTPGRPVLVLFRGPQAYVSPSWYPDKAEHGKVVPTWNYIVVQALGTLRVHDDAEWVHQQITAVTRHMESPRTAPWAVSDAPEDYLEMMRRAIVGIEVEVTQWCGKWKMSQNHSTERQNGVREGLMQDAHAKAQAQAWGVAQAMASAGDQKP